MKNVKILLLFCFLALVTVSYSQIEVDSNNRILFGKKVYNNAISIADERTGTSTTGVPFRIFRTNGDRIWFTRSISSPTNGFTMLSNGTNAMGNNIPTSIQSDEAALSLYSNNLWQGLLLNMSGSRLSDAIGIMPTAGWQGTLIYYWGNSPNTFIVGSDGGVVARSYSSVSDVSLKREITTLSNPLEKVMQIRGVCYYMGNEQKEEIPFDELLSNLKKRNPEITSETLKQMQAEKKRKEIGVIAQEVEKVLPEAVSTLENGLKAVSYSDLTVLLIEAVKEQQSIIDDLKLEVAAIKGNSMRSSEMTGLANDLIVTCKLSQNIPNPFNEQTEISYYVAPGVENAFICIFDMQGKMLQKWDAQVGQNTLLIEGSQLEAGMYLYSLFVDGQEVDTKRMLLTK